MSESSVAPVCAFDIGDDGTVRAVTSRWPGTETSDTYRWLHFDLNDPGFAAWAQAHLPHIAAKALLQSETRPRCEATPAGMILNLRGVNLNPGADAEDMVSIRLWVDDGLIVSARRYKLFAIDAIRADIDAGNPPKDIPAFLAALAFGLTKRIETISLGLEEGADALEELAFDPKAPRLENLPEIRQSIIKLRRFVRPQAEALKALGAGVIWPLDEVNATYLRDTINRNQRTLEELDATCLLYTSDAAEIFLPLGFLTGLFGINVGGMPLINSDIGFAVVAGGSAAIGILVLLVFRVLRWL